MSFDAVKVKNDIVEWIKNWFDTTGPDCNAVVAIPEKTTTVPPRSL